VKLFLSVFALLVALPGVAQAAGQVFLQNAASSPAEYAELIQVCDTAKGLKLNVGCEELVQSFNKAFPKAQGIVDKHSLAAYIRTLVVRPCPNVETRVARPVGRRVDLNYRRQLREGETCLYDPGLNGGQAGYISTMWFAQWLPETLPAPMPATVVPPERPIVTSPGPLSGASEAQASKPAASSSTAIQEAAHRTATGTLTANSDAAAAHKPSKGRHPLSLKRKSGKIFWISTAVAGTICGFTCRGKIIQEVNIYR
jgi:hypothetical protein